MSPSAQAKRVLIFKKKDKDDKYNELFRQQGYIPEFIPVLDHRLENVDVLKNIITHAPEENDIGGIVVTSQRSVEALHQACHLALSESSSGEDGKTFGSPFQTWKYVPAYIVGPQTAEALAKTPLYHDTTASNSIKKSWIIASRATELIAPLLDHYAKCRQQQQSTPLSNGGTTTTAKTNTSTLLFLAGDKRRDVIPETLKEARIPFKELQVYATCAHPDLNGNLEDYLDRYSPRRAAANAPDWWTVYFSPSGVKFILSSVQNPELKDFILACNNGEKQDHHQRPRVAAIGPTTADYLSTGLNIKPDVIADKPDAAHLVQSILTFHSKNQL